MATGGVTVVDDAALPEDGATSPSDDTCCIERLKDLGLENCVNAEGPCPHCGKEASVSNNDNNNHSVTTNGTIPTSPNNNSGHHFSTNQVLDQVSNGSNSNSKHDITNSGPLQSPQSTSVICKTCKKSACLGCTPTQSQSLKPRTASAGYVSSAWADRRRGGARSIFLSKIQDLPARPVYQMSGKLNFRKVQHFSPGVAGGVCITPAGKIIITQLNHRKITILSATDGRKIRDMMTPPGTEAWDVESNDTHIYVTDRKRKVFVFDYDGKLVTTMDLTRHINITDTAGIALVDNMIYITGGVSNGVYKIQQYRNKRHFRPQMLDLGVTLKYPLFICIRGDLMALNSSKDHCIYVTDMNGELKYSHGMPGKRGKAPGQLNNPYGVVFDSKNRMFIADWKNHRVIAVSDSGAYLGHIDLAKEELEYPLGVTLNHQGNLVVSCDNPGQLLIYEYFTT